VEKGERQINVFAPNCIKFPIAPYGNAGKPSIALLGQSLNSGYGINVLHLAEVYVPARIK
jgi:hypothetical protein